MNGVGNAETPASGATSGGASGAGGEGSNGAQSDWRASLPEHYEVDGQDAAGQPVKSKVPFRANPALKDFKDPASLARSYIDTKALVGQALKVPGEKSTPEERKAFYVKLGVPEKPDGYEAAGVRMPAFEMPVNQDRLAEVAAQFHALGFTPQQYQAALNVYAEEINAGVTAQSAGLEALKQDWGLNFEPRVERAARLVRQFFPKGTAEFLNATGKGNNPLLIRGLYELSTKLREGEFVSGAGGGGELGGDAAKAQIDEIRRDPKHPAMDPANPGHRAARARLDALYRAAYGTQEIP